MDLQPDQFLQFATAARPKPVQWDLANILLAVVYSLRKNPRACCKSGIHLHVSWGRDRNGNLKYKLHAYLRPTFEELAGQVVSINEEIGGRQQTTELLAQLIAEFESECGTQMDLLFA